jgi:hypothetical protein
LSDEIVEPSMVSAPPQRFSASTSPVQNDGDSDLRVGFFWQIVPRLTTRGGEIGQLAASREAEVNKLSSHPRIHHAPDPHADPLLGPPRSPNRLILFKLVFLDPVN